MYHSRTIKINMPKNGEIQFPFDDWAIRERPFWGQRYVCGVTAGSSNGKWKGKFIDFSAIWRVLLAFSKIIWRTNYISGSLLIFCVTMDGEFEINLHKMWGEILIYLILWRNHDRFSIDFLGWTYDILVQLWAIFTQTYYLEII